MRAQQGLIDTAMEMKRKLSPKPLIFYIAIGFFLIYSFVMTQGLSPSETIGGENIKTKVCDELLRIVPVKTTADLYTFQRLCTNFVCRTEYMNGSRMYDTQINQINQIAYTCNSNDDDAFELFTQYCSNYCAKGIFDVQSIADTISEQVGMVFGRPDYCIFLKKGPMSSVLIPKCTGGITYNGQPVNLCMKGFSCYLSGPGVPDYKCDCADLYNFRKASKQYLGDSQTLRGASYEKEEMYTDFGDDNILSCGEINEINFEVNDPSKLEWWFRHRAFPPETDDIGWNSFVSNKFPKPICIMTFGLLPFLVIFFLLKDTIFYFVPLRQGLKNLAALFIALLSLVFGTFDNIVLFISKLSGWSLSFGFLFCIFGVAVIGSISNVIMKNMLERRRKNQRVLEFASALGELSE